MITLNNNTGCRFGFAYGYYYPGYDSADLFCCIGTDTSRRAE